MPVDSSIYLQQQAPDIMGSVGKGLQLSSLMSENRKLNQERSDDQATREAFKNNMTADANGQPTLNRQGVLSDLAKAGLGQKAYDMQRTWQQQDLQQHAAQVDSHIKNANATGQILNGVNDQPTYDQAMTTLEKLGLVSPENHPKQYDQKYVDGMKNQALTVKDQAESAQKEIHLGIEQRNADSNAKRADAESRKADSSAGQRADDKEYKMGQDLEKHLSQGWAGRSGQAGVVQGKINAAEAAEALGQQIKSQPGGADSRQIEELAQSATRMLGGTAQASARVEALVPHTAFGRVQSFKEWISNKPTGLDQQAFTDRILETVSREKALADTQKRQFQVEGLPAFQALKKKNPQLYDSILQSKGIDSSMVDEKSRYKAPAKSDDASHPQDAAAVQWAKQNPNDPRSAAILKANGF